MNKEERDKIYRKAGLLTTLEAKERDLERIENIGAMICPPYSVKICYSDSTLAVLPISPILKEYFVSEISRNIKELRKELESV